MSENDAENVNLTPAQHKAIAALLEMRSIEEAATEAGVTSRTLYRWRNDPLFVAAVRAAQGDNLHELSRQFHAETPQSLEAMTAIRDDATIAAGVRLRAAHLIVQVAIELQNAVNTETRLAAVEELLKQEGRL